MPCDAFFKKNYSIIKFKQLGIRTFFGSTANIPFIEIIQYLAKVRKMIPDNSQWKNDVSMESENQQGECLEGLKYEEHKRVLGLGSIQKPQVV